VNFLGWQWYQAIVLVVVMARNFKTGKLKRVISILKQGLPPVLEYIITFSKNFTNGEHRISFSKIIYMGQPLNFIRQLATI